MPSIDKTANCPKRPRRRQKPTLAITLVADQRIVLACRLDRNADLLLSLNCHIAVASRMWWKWPDWRVSARGDGCLAQAARSTGMGSVSFSPSVCHPSTLRMMI